MTNATARLRIVGAERMANTPNGNPRWRLRPESGGVLTTAPDSQIAHERFDGWVGKWAVLTVNGKDEIVAARLLDGAPDCGCCGGSGEHYFRAYVGGTSPEDDDVQCSACEGRGETYFETRHNGCSGYRVLMRRNHR